MNGLNGDLPPHVDSHTDQTTIDSTTTNEDVNKEEETNVEHDLSTVLIVSNLARPFTLTGLKKVLSKCGKIIDDRFWLNKDKTKCYVCYENEQIASESRQYINSLKWPASNPNTLESTFGGLDELDELIRKDEEERLQFERERKEAAQLEAAKQEERKQQLKEELSKKFNESLIGADGLVEQQNGDLSINSTAKVHINNNVKSTTMNEDESNQERAVSPARNAETNVIHITNLERGFTVKQFKDLLSKHGKLIDEKFWIDRIKSQCYAVYETNDDALKARNQLHRLKWPRTNTKTLRVDFGKLNDVNKLLDGGATVESKSKEDKSTAAAAIVNKDSANDKDVKVSSNKDDKSIEKDQPQAKDKATTKQDESKENLNENKQAKKKSPARNPISNIIYVRGLSRPFTIQQLKELLSQDGCYDEEKFWIDKVKSQCFVVYENEEIASKTRDRLHRLTWPAGNQRRLVADFASETELEVKLNLIRLDKASKEIHEQQKTKDEERNKERHNRSGDRPKDHSFSERDKNGRYEEMNVDQDRNEFEENSSNKRKRERSLTPTPRKRDQHRLESPIGRFN